MIRTIIWFIWFAISLIISIPLMFRVKYLIKKNRIEESKALIYKCTNLWANSLLKVAGVKVNVHGLENIPKDKAVLFVGNHQGNFDIPIYITQIPLVIGFISKIEVEKIPLVRTWMNFMHCVFMDRSNLRKSGEAIIKGIKNLKSGHSIVIFPEGIFGLFLGDADEDIFALAREYVPIAILMFIASSLRATMNALINGSGNAKLNFLTAILDGIVLRIGLAVLFGLVLNMKYICICRQLVCSFVSKAVKCCYYKIWTTN